MLIAAFATGFVTSLSPMMVIRDMLESPFRMSEPVATILARAQNSLRPGTFTRVLYSEFPALMYRLQRSSSPHVKFVTPCGT